MVGLYLHGPCMMIPSCGEPNKTAILIILFLSHPASAVAYLELLLPSLRYAVLAPFFLRVHHIAEKSNCPPIEPAS